MLDWRWYSSSKVHLVIHLVIQLVIHWGWTRTKKILLYRREQTFDHFGELPSFSSTHVTCMELLQGLNNLLLAYYLNCQFILLPINKSLLIKFDHELYDK